MIIGITGTDGAGKGTVVEYLVKKKDFIHYSAREIFIEELEKRGTEKSRANMRLVANELRGEYGNDFLITYYLSKIKSEDVENAVIDSLRAIDEAKTLQKEGGIVIAVDADQDIRYERVQKRRSDTDKVNFETFKKHEELEMNDPDPHGMQKAKVVEMADYSIENNGSIDDLYVQVEEVFSRL